MFTFSSFRLFLQLQAFKPLVKIKNIANRELEKSHERKGIKKTELFLK